ncbi:MAG: hypothetical protein Q7R33_02060 [Nitrosarchaeum sp.]|nr:hypothetical protein [Nitrosarchaeum sp.]
MPVGKTNLTSGGGKDTLTFDTASITPSANKLILLSCTAYDGDSTVPEPTVSGCGLTWVKIDTRISGDNHRRVTLFRAMGASPSSGAVTITFSIALWGCAWGVSEFGSVDTSGTNGSGAIVQSAVNGVDGALGLTITLAAFGSTNNATFGAFGSSHTTTVGSGFIQVNTYQTDPGQWYENTNTQEWRDDNDTSVDISTGWGDIHGVAVEIKYAAPTLSKTTTTWIPMIA